MNKKINMDDFEFEGFDPYDQLMEGIRGQIDAHIRKAVEAIVKEVLDETAIYLNKGVAELVETYDYSVIRQYPNKREEPGEPEHASYHPAKK